MKGPRRSTYARKLRLWAECEHCGARFLKERPSAEVCTRTCRYNIHSLLRREGTPRAGRLSPSFWELEERERRLSRLALVSSQQPGLCWEALAERFGVPLHEWQAWKAALRQRGHRPPPMGGAWG